MTYLIRVAIILTGGTASIAAYHATLDLLFPMIILILCIAVFIASFVWRMFHLEDEQKHYRN